MRHRLTTASLRNKPESDACRVATASLLHQHLHFTHLTNELNLVTFSQPSISVPHTLFWYSSSQSSRMTPGVYTNNQGYWLTWVTSCVKGSPNNPSLQEHQILSAVFHNRSAITHGLTSDTLFIVYPPGPPLRPTSLCFPLPCPYPVFLVVCLWAWRSFLFLSGGLASTISISSPPSSLPFISSIACKIAWKTTKHDT